MERLIDEERLINRVKAIRDNILCQHIGEVYQSLSPEELGTLWKYRGELGLDINELRLLRDITRTVRGFQAAPPAAYISHEATNDWWSRPVDK